MKYVYKVEMSISRGGEFLSTNRTYFDSRELAQKVLEKTKQVNSELEYEIEYTINKMKVYENEQEVPIMNQ